LHICQRESSTTALFGTLRFLARRFWWFYSSL
jgi:hypothetical protein